MSNTPVSSENRSPRLIPGARRNLEGSRVQTIELLRKTGITQEPSPEQPEAYRLWMALKQFYSQAIEAQQRVALVRSEAIALQEQLAQLSAENIFLKQSSERRQEDFQALKKLEIFWTDRESKQSIKIRTLEEKNRKLEGFLNRTKTAIHARFDWLKSYQERLKTYASSLNEEKSRIKALASQISVEIDNSERPWKDRSAQISQWIQNENLSPTPPTPPQPRSVY